MNLQKLFAGVTLSLLLFTQLQVGQIYANYEVEINSTKKSSIELLEKIGTLSDSIVSKLEEKTSNNKKLSQKHQEIQKYLEKTKEEIQNENSNEDIKEKLKKAKKIIVLKVISGITNYKNLEDNLSTIKTDKKSKALETLKKSLKHKTGDYTLIIRTKNNKTQLEKQLSKYDENLVVDFMYTQNQKNYFEITISKDSLFSQEFLENIENGILPQNFLGIKIIEPQLLQISSLEGEELEKTRGIQQYKTYEKFEEIKNLEGLKNLKVGILDTGIDTTHSDLQTNIDKTLGYNFIDENTQTQDNQGHGTHIAGIIGANLNNNGIVGINPYVQLVPLKICDENGFCPNYAVLKSLEYAKENNINILNISLSGNSNPLDNSICDGIASLTQSGGIVVTSAGNSNTDASNTIPGGCTDSITVGATDQTGNKAIFSNYGSTVDVQAPGVGIYSTYPVEKGNYKELSGTSMAVAHISGIVSILKSYKPELTTEQIKKALKQNLDLDNLISYINSEEINEVGETKDERLKSKDGVEIDSDLVFVENQEELDNQANTITQPGLGSKDESKSKRLFCETTVGVNCEFEWDKEKSEYTYKYQKEGITKVSLKENKLVVEALKPGKTEVQVRENGKLIFVIKITIGEEIKTLKLETYELELVGIGTTKTIQIPSYYEDITSIKKSNDNINVYLEENGEGGKQLKIEAQKVGETIVEVTDENGNIRTLKVTVEQTTEDILKEEYEKLFEDFTLQFRKDLEKILFPENNTELQISTTELSEEMKVFLDNFIAGRKQKIDVMTLEDGTPLTAEGKAIVTGILIDILNELKNSLEANPVYLEVFQYIFDGLQKIQDEYQKESENEMDDELTRELKRIFREIGLSIDDLEINSYNSEDTLKISTFGDAFRCKKQSTGEYWVRPYYSTCTDSQKYVTWTCKSGYTDFYTSQIGVVSSCLQDLGCASMEGDERKACDLQCYINSCVVDKYANDVLKFNKYRNIFLEKINVLINKKWKSIELKYSDVEYAELMKQEFLNGLLAKLNSIRENIADEKFNNILDSAEREEEEIKQAGKIFLIDDTLNKLDQKTIQQAKERTNVLQHRRAFKLAASNGEECYDAFDGNYVCEEHEEFKWKSDIEEERYNQVEQYAGRFSEEFINYQAKYDEDYKEALNTNATDVTTYRFTEEDLKNVVKGTTEGAVLATRDYSMQRVDLATGIFKLKFSDIEEGFTEVKNFTKDPIGGMKGIASELGDIMIESYLIADTFGPYEYSKGGGYLGTTVGFAVANPTGGLLKSSKYIAKISGFIKSLNNRIKALGLLAEFGNFIKKARKAFGDGNMPYIIARINFMDNAKLQANLKDLDGFIAKFKSLRTLKLNRYVSKIDLQENKVLKYTKDKLWRLDLESFDGVGGVHIQSMQNGKIKYFYNYAREGFYDDYGLPAPKSIQKLKDNIDIKNGLEKAKTYLDINNEIGI